MKISSMLSRENIVFIETGNSAEEIIRLLTEKLINSEPAADIKPAVKSCFLKKILEREAKGCTALGNGIAFPHARIKELNTPLIALGIVKNGINCKTLDNKPVKLFFLFIYPEHAVELAIKIQSVFARLIDDEANVNNILESKDTDQVYKIIEALSPAINTPITALDLMSEVKVKCCENMSLQDATHLMKKHNTETASVVDNSGKLLGEIDCIHLFLMELPDYIKKLHSVPPIHDFNPFIHYFTDDADASLKNLYNREIAIVEPDTQLFEIIFLLSVKKHSIVHVCKGDEYLGTIDRNTVLHKIFNL